MSIYMFD